VTDARQLARICKVLSVDTRVRIVQLLKGRTLCVGALSARLGVTQSAVSQHLRVLRDAGLVVPEKRGYYVHYRLDKRMSAKWKETLAGLLRAEPALAGAGNARNSMKGTRQCVMKRQAAKSPKN